MERKYCLLLKKIYSIIYTCNERDGTRSGQECSSLNIYLSCALFLLGCDLMNKDKYYMNVALKEARKAYLRGEVPVGCIIVLNDKIIARGHNLRETTGDILKHAELITIKKCCKKIGDWRLEDSVMYVTLFPCPMCASAIVQSRIKKIVIEGMRLGPLKRLECIE